MIDIINGDALTVLKTMDDCTINCCVTSPPYWGLRDYGIEGQLGLERTPAEYVAKMVEVFREVRRVLWDDGTLWLNLGDSYASAPPGNTTKGVSAKSTLHGVNGKSGAYRETLAASVQTKRNTIVGSLKPKDLCGIPWRVAFALQADGWYLRQDIIWHKPNPMPESVTDRCTKSHEYIFLMSKSQRYYYDAEAIKEPDSGQQHARSVFDGAPSLEPSGGIKTPHTGICGTPDKNGQGRNKRSVWTVSIAPFHGAHFATFPPKLIEPCILAGCPTGGTVLDPFGGSGTVGMVSEQNGRNSIIIELNPAYVKMAKRRTAQVGLFTTKTEAIGNTNYERDDEETADT